MKIGILTFHWANNYGAVLQAFALQNVLTDMGHTVEIIDYRPIWASDNQHITIQNSFGGIINAIGNKIRKETFNKFRKNYLHLSHNKCQIGDTISDYDIVLTGSDQVFNPDIIENNHSFDYMYLLQTVATGVSRCSYAASFGNSTLASKYQTKYKQLLSDFKHISVREHSGVNIINELGINAIEVPDPTILLPDFKKIIGKQYPRQKYILSIIFQPDKHICNIQENFANKNNLPIKYILSLKDILKGKRGFLYPSPKHWIQAIDNAEFVITDSFHCTLFCLLCHTPFITFSLNGWGTDWSERIKNLLDRTGLQDRLLDYKTENINKFYNTPIDWEIVDVRLAKMKTIGLNYLKDITSVK